MMIFESMRRELSELVRLVRESANYCTSVSSRPELASPESHALEIQREHRIAELRARFGLDS
ncbi:hypothetical protein LJR118_006704 [Acidovorax sp. LjRoot118]|uniref:hypothetical protein n=1 Tax=Acidovorax sp. LjRoot118 TaxID=3342256 RepID=UPI003ECD705B